MQTYLVCYLRPQGGVKLTEKYTLYPSGHAHHYLFVRAISPQILDQMFSLTNFHQTASFR